jgi:hypothetical protein
MNATREERKLQRKDKRRLDERDVFLFKNKKGGNVNLPGDFITDKSIYLKGEQVR